MGGKENTCIATEVIVRTVIQQSNWFYLSQHFCNMQYFRNTQVQLFIQLIITTEVLMNASPLILSHTVGKHQVSTAICHSLSPPHQVSLSHTHISKPYYFHYFHFCRWIRQVTERQCNFPKQYAMAITKEGTETDIQILVGGEISQRN